MAKVGPGICKCAEDSDPCTADLESAGDYFFLRAKLIMGQFEGFFEGAETLKGKGKGKRVRE